MPISTDRDIFVPQNSGNIRLSQTHPLSHADLSFKGAETQHSTHSLHPYVAAINPPLVAALIDYFVPQNGTIYDPYCGGGGVLVEGLLKNRTVAGGDINPLAVHISNAKTTWIPKELIRDYCSRILQPFNNIQTDASSLKNIPKTIQYWFKPDTLQSLVALKRCIQSAELPEDAPYAQELSNLFSVIFSSTIRDVMLTYRGEVRLRKLQGSDYENFHPDVHNAFEKRAALAMERVPLLPRNSHPHASLTDATYLPFADNYFSTIICSPPYGDDKNGVGYFQFSSKMLYFLGYENLKPYKNLFLGGVKDHKTPPPSNSLEESLEHVLQRNEDHYKEAVAFYRDYYTALNEMVRVASDRIIIVVGNRVLSRTVFDNAKITVEMLASLGVPLEHYFQRTIPKKRIANLGNDGGGSNQEHILIFKL